MKKNLLWILILVVCISVLTVGCGAESNGNRESAASDADALMQSPASKAPIYAEEQESFGDQSVEVDFVERKVIKNCEININVENLEEVVKEIENKTEIMGGLISEANSQINRNGNNISGNMRLRIPADNFVEMVRFIEEKGEVRRKRVYTNDVTEEYIDLDAKVAVLEAEEKSLLTILEKAENVGEMLQVKEYLLNVKKERESFQGRLKYLKNQVSYSTVHVQLYQPVTSGAQVQANSFKNVWDNSLKALIKSVNGVMLVCSNLIVFGFGIAPIALPLGGAIFLVLFLKKRRRKSGDEPTKE